MRAGPQGLVGSCTQAASFPCHLPTSLLSQLWEPETSLLCLALGENLPVLLPLHRSPVRNQGGRTDVSWVSFLVALVKGLSVLYRLDQPWEFIFTQRSTGSGWALIRTGPTPPSMTPCLGRATYVRAGQTQPGASIGWAGVQSGSTSLLLGMGKPYLAYLFPEHAHALGWRSWVQVDGRVGVLVCGCSGLPQPPQHSVTVPGPPSI